MPRCTYSRGPFRNRQEIMEAQLHCTTCTSTCPSTSSPSSDRTSSTSLLAIFREATTSLSPTPKNFPCSLVSFKVTYLYLTHFPFVHYIKDLRALGDARAYKIDTLGFLYISLWSNFPLFSYKRVYMRARELLRAERICIGLPRARTF